MKKYKVGVVGCTGMVGQRFITLLENHPWFQLTAIAASARSAGKPYEEAVSGRWKMDTPIPEEAKQLIIYDIDAQMKEFCDQIDFTFCAVDMDKDATRALEERIAKMECPVVSNNSAHRFTPDVPMVVPEINPEHVKVIPYQKQRLGTQRGFIAVKSNCSLQSYVPALHPLREKFGVEKALVCTYQAISGAGKNFETWPEMVDNVIPYIGGEEEKSEQEPMKMWGHIENGVFMTLGKKTSVEEIKEIWQNYKGRAQELELPSAPKQFLQYFEDPSYPQTKLQRDLEGGMAISLGRLRPDTQYDYKFVGLSHNTLRGAAGGSVLLGEFLVAEGYIDYKE